MELTFKKKLFYFFPVLFCFCLPFGSRVLSALVAGWAFVSFFNLGKEQLIAGLKNKNLWLLWSFFLLTVISALFSSNKSEASFSVEVKLVFLFFPYLFFCFYWPPEILKRCLVAFVSGCFFACVYLISRAFYYSLNGHPQYFFYTLFSDLIHASYFAMYLITAIILVVLFYKKWFSSQKTVMYSSYVFIAVFTVTVFLCSSKLGMISFVLCMPLLLLYKWKSYLNAKKIIVLLLAIVLLVFGASKIFSGSFARLNSLSTVSASPDKTSAESTAVRMLIWQQAWQLSRQNFLLGTGVGDANDKLYEAYAQNGLTGALDHKLNAHNQFFQTMIGMGMLGSLLLLMLTLGQLVKGFIRKNFLLCIFSFIIILNFLVESMLQTSAGIFFFTFFFCVFNLTDEKKLLSE